MKRVIRMSRSRRIGLRLVQASPLLALLIVMLLFSALPPTLSLGLLLGMEGVAAPAARRARMESVDMLDQQALLRKIGMSDANDGAQARWLDVYENVVSRQQALLEAPARADFPIPADDQIWKPVESTESRWNAAVWVWMMTMPARPALVSSATVNPALMQPLRVQMRLAVENESRRSGPVAVSLEDFLYRDAGLPQGKLPPILGQELEINTGSGGGGDDYWTGNATISRGGRLFRVAVVMPPRDDGQSIIDEDRLALLDPTAADSDERTANLARAMNANVFVFGPIEPRFLSLRAPAGVSRATADRMAESIFPWWFARAPQGGYAPARTLEGSAAELFDAQVASVSVWDHSRISGGVQYAAAELAPQSMMVLTTWDDVLTAPPPASVFRRSLQRVVAGSFPTLSGFAITLLFAALVASGSAFVYERRLAARERLREEMARMRRDAHDRVYNRLSALSKRVGAAGDRLAAESSASIAAIAEDIRGTVGDIQRILGDEGRHTDSGLAQVPLAEQVRAVCSAQAARLGIVVECHAPDALPEASAALGWDLQCIVEEAITNAVRHGRASRVDVRVESTSPAQVRATVTDNGSGTDVRSSSEVAVGSTGLRGMAERAARWGGEVRLSRTETGGTQLEATFRLG